MMYRNRVENDKYFFRKRWSNKIQNINFFVEFATVCVDIAQTTSPPDVVKKAPPWHFILKIDEDFGA